MQSSLFGGTNAFQQPSQQQQQPQSQFQQQQQFQQQVPSVFNNVNTQVQPLTQPSRFEKYELKNASDHRLFSSESSNSASQPRGTASGSVNGNKIGNGSGSLIKKRTIPNRLIKRVGKQDSNSNEEDKSSGPVLPFKVSTQVQPDTFAEDFAHLYKVDKPPSNSMFDPSIFQDETTPGEMLIGESIFNKMDENPTLFENIFKRPSRNLLKLENHSKYQSAEYPWSNSNTLPPNNSQGLEDSSNGNKQPSPIYTTSSAMNRSISSTEKLYCSVIVYGFDDAYFSLIIEHFAKYGKIMENLVISDYNYYYGAYGNVIARDKLVDIDDKDRTGIDSKKKPLDSFPLFLGPGWVKITYDNPNSAIRALADNLTDDGKGNVLGVIPYRREDLEILLSHKIPNELNMGEGLHGLSHELELEKRLANNEIGKYLSAARGDSLDSSNGTKRTASSLTVKDGSNLLLKTRKESDGKTIWHKGMGFLFGQGEV